MQKRFNTIQSDEDTKSNMDFIFKRAYEEKLLPSLVPESNHSQSSSFSKSLSLSNRDYRIHSLSLTRPLKFTKEDFIDPEVRFKRIYDPFISGKKPVEYFKNVIVDAYAFEPKIVFEDCEEQQKKSPFKDLQIPSKKYAVFSSKIDDAFIGHKMYEIESPLKGGTGELLSFQNASAKLNTSQSKKDDFYDEKNINLTQYKQNNSMKLFPSIGSHDSFCSDDSKNLQFSFRNKIDSLSKKNRLKKGNFSNLQLQQLTTNETSGDLQFNPYSPEQSHKANYNFKSNLPESRVINQNRQTNTSQQKEEQYGYDANYENVSSIRKNHHANQNTHSDTRITVLPPVSHVLKDSFERLHSHRTLNVPSIQGAQKPAYQEQNQYNLAQHSRGNQNKRGRLASIDSSVVNSHTLSKDSRYLIENFASVHSLERIRENPIQEYMVKQNELTKKRIQLYEVI